MQTGIDTSDDGWNVVKFILKLDKGCLFSSSHAT